MKSIFILTIEVNCFFIQCLIFLSNNGCNLANALFGPNVRSAEENELAFVVSISRSHNLLLESIEGLHRCTGTLISRQDALTAEHCVVDILPTAFHVLVGSVDLASTTSYRPLFFLSYERWSLTRNSPIDMEHNDIAFVKLIGNVPETIQPANLGNAPLQALVGLDVQVAGWGKGANNELPRILQTVNVKVLSKRQCEGRVLWRTGYIFFMNERNMCTAAEPYALMNSGDSGGPVLLHGSLVAINKGLIPRFDEMVHPEQTNFHTGIRYYYPFITDVLSNTVLNF